MTMSDPNIERDCIANELSRSMKARIELMQMTGKKLADEYRDKVACTLLEASLTLIPSDHLQDHQFVVSRGVYEAACRAVKANGGRTP